jgi:hypothetical protein
VYSPFTLTGLIDAINITGNMLLGDFKYEVLKMLSEVYNSFEFTVKQSF